MQFYASIILTFRGFCLCEIIAEEEKLKIRLAFEHSEANTCVRFAEVELGTNLTGNHLLLTKTNSDS